MCANLLFTNHTNHQQNANTLEKFDRCLIALSCAHRIINPSFHFEDIFIHSVCLLSFIFIFMVKKRKEFSK